MNRLTLSRDQRLSLRARAHHLKPVVLLGAAGLTEAVLKETDRALTAHALIKVRVPGDDRDERESIGSAMADRLGAALVQVIGKLLVLYRPPPPEPPPGARPHSDRSSERRPRAAAGGHTAVIRTSTERAAKRNGSRRVAKISSRPPAPSSRKGGRSR